MDAETFGHHIKHWEELFLAEVYKQIQPLGEGFASSKRTSVLHHRSSSFCESTDIAQAIKPVTVSQLVDLFPIGKAVNPRLSSWSTSKEDLVDGNPYPLWKHKDNKIHSLQWEHLDICLALVNEAVKVSGDDEAIRFASTVHSFLDRALYSCQFWWASKRPMWDINLVHKGLLEQWQAIVNAYQAISLSQAGKDTKRDCYHKLIVARNLRDKNVVV